MKERKTTMGVVWYLGTIQYCICLFGGGAIWFLIAQLTGFFGDDLLTKVGACLLLALIIVCESLWAHMPGNGNQTREFAMDILTSAAIAGFGMAVVAILLSGLLLR